jgi:hypothetical protein
MAVSSSPRPRVKARRVNPAVLDQARLLGAENLARGGKALLRVAVQGQRSATDYWVSEHKIGGRLVGYRLSKFADQGGEVYDLDLSFGGWAHVECDCRDYPFKRRLGLCCKHCVALATGLGVADQRPQAPARCPCGDRAVLSSGECQRCADAAADRWARRHDLDELEGA